MKNAGYRESFNLVVKGIISDINDDKTFYSSAITYCALLDLSTRKRRVIRGFQWQGSDLSSVHKYDE